MKAPDRHHPADDLLVALYFGDADGDADEQRSARQHLHGCEACTWRYAELVAPLEKLRADAASEADEIFTPARLEAQRLAIRERIESGARASRVVPFPARTTNIDRAVIARPMFRWIAAAAAAGLLVGVSAGRFISLDYPGSGGSSSPAVARTVAPQGGSTVPAVARPDSTDEAFLTEVEAAVSRHRIRALTALDELTPHAREAVLARR